MGDVRRAAHGAVATAQDHLRVHGRVARAGMAALGVSGPIPRWLYAKLGRRYPTFVITLEFAVAHAVVAGSILLLTLYVPMSLDEFLWILLVAELVVGIENLFATRLVAKLLHPVTAWLNGSREPEETLDAWTALAALPTTFVKRWGRASILFSVPPLALFITFELGLPPEMGIPLLVVGGLGVLAYGSLLRFFAMELVLRPVLEDIAGDLPEDFEIVDSGFSLKSKIMVALPMVNIVTGVVVAALTQGGGRGITGFGLDVALAVVVAGTISLEVNLLLSRAILTPLLNLRHATERLAAGDLTARVAVISADETGELATSFNRMATGLEERERLREAFGAFVDPDVAERILEEGALDGEEAEVSVLFLDIRDFTAFAERASAREVVARLNHFYERVVPVLTRHGGHANKFIGDGLLGVFGTPERHADHADRAVACALQIAGLIQVVYGDDLRVGIGVNSGPVMAGTIGGGGRLDFTVIGDAVNTASRVEHVTRETGDVILITEATRCLLTRDLGGFEERPSVELKGKTEQVRLWAPLEQARLQPDLEPISVGDGLRSGIEAVRRRRRGRFR
ncbi:MAG: adenylate cyclase [Thermoleophilaceae bacterium]|nr:adenylate cyclase [Thermoleophilaceae bacterium]